MSGRILTRRQFLRSIASVAAGAVVLPEVARVFLPPAGGWNWRPFCEPIINESLLDEELAGMQTWTFSFSKPIIRIMHDEEQFQPRHEWFWKLEHQP